MYSQVNLKSFIQPPQMPKQKKIKEPKPPKEPKPKKIKEVEEVKELTPQEFVDKLIEEKQKVLDNKYIEIDELETALKSLKSKLDKPILINERRLLVSKLSSIIPKKNEDEDKKKAKFEEMKKSIKKFDEHFEIIADDLQQFDFKY